MLFGFVRIWGQRLPDRDLLLQIALALSSLLFPLIESQALRSLASTHIPTRLSRILSLLNESQGFTRLRIHSHTLRQMVLELTTNT